MRATKAKEAKLHSEVEVLRNMLMTPPQHHQKLKDTKPPVKKKASKKLA